MINVLIFNENYETSLKNDQICNENIPTFYEKNVTKYISNLKYRLQILFIIYCYLFYFYFNLTSGYVFMKLCGFMNIFAQYIILVVLKIGFKLSLKNILILISGVD